MLGFWRSDAVLIGVQAALVAGPRPAVPAAVGQLLVRLRTSAWAAVLPVSLGGTIALLAVAPDTAELYTWLALVAVPLLTVPALHTWMDGWMRRRANGRPPGSSTRARPGAWMVAAAVSAVLFVIAWRVPGLAGEGAAVAMTALSCATLAVLVGELAPVATLKVGIVVMAVLDAVLVFGQLLEGPNDHLNSAAPGAGLPQLQLAAFGSALVGYGDLFIAAVLGVVLARQVTRGPSRRRQLVFAAVTLICSAAFDLLFFAVDVLPATVPVAVALVVAEVADRLTARRQTGEPDSSVPDDTVLDESQPAS